MGNEQLDFVTPSSTPVIPTVKVAGRRDPLDEGQAASLLDPVDVIRDPVHGDVRLTSLERCIIDTASFQRLRNINQLGLTVVAYPGAVHSRFLHSIGVLHVCANMLATCNENAAVYTRLAADSDPIPLRLSPYQALLARLCALMHDMAHVPFGHTLEKEGRIFERDEWQDTERAEKLVFGPESDLSRAMRSFFVDHGLTEAQADAVREDVKAVLATSRDDVETLPYPFIHDLVGNTICADLIDYVERDMYFCGLEERCGDRYLEYLAVVPLESGKTVRSPVRTSASTAFATASGADGGQVACRVVLLLYRYNERHEAVVKHGVVEEAIDLVRRRLALAEKVYFHRTKVVASSMLVSAAYEAGLTAKEIWELSDSEVLKKLAGDKNIRVSSMAQKLKDRHLFKPIYRASFHPQDQSRASGDLWGKKGAYTRFLTPSARAELERRLERIVDLMRGGNGDGAAGSVSIYCPDSRMNVKAFDMLVLRDPDGEPVRRLQDTNHPPTRKEIEAIHESHNNLWRLEVFVDPSIVELEPQNPDVQRFAGAIQYAIGPKNEISGFGDAKGEDLDAWERELFVDRTLEELSLSDTVTNNHYRELLTQSNRGWDPTKQRALLIADLKERGYLGDDGGEG